MPILIPIYKLKKVFNLKCEEVCRFSLVFNSYNFF